jgi:hypothetical protein
MCYARGGGHVKKSFHHHHHNQAMGCMSLAAIVLQMVSKNFPLAPVHPQSSICLPRHARCVRVATPELAVMDQGCYGTA